LKASRGSKPFKPFSVDLLTRVLHGHPQEELLHEAWRLQVIMMLSRPDAASAAHMYRAGRGAAGAERLADMLRALSLRPAQRRALLALRKLYLLNLGRWALPHREPGNCCGPD